MCSRESPWEKEKQGELQQAATLYAVEAMNGMMASNFGESSARSYRIALSKFFLAISCDVRNGANNRSESLFEFICPLVRELAEKSDDPVLRGIAKEWVGDGLLMLDRSGATQYYIEASELYNDANFEDFYWGLEEEVTNEFYSFQVFAEFCGAEEFFEPNLDVNFIERIEKKIEFSNQI